MKPLQVATGGLVLVVALVLAFVVPRPRLDNSAESFLRGADDQAFATYARFLDTFGSDELVVLELEGPADRSLALARRFERRLAEAPGVIAVAGFPTLFESATEVLLDPELGGFDNLARVRPQLEGPLNQSLRLFEPDSGRALTLLTLEPAPPEDRAPLRARLEELRAEAEESGLSLRMAGNPLVNLALDQASRDLEASAMPLLVVTCALLLILFTGSLQTSLATLISIGLAVFALEGFLSLAGRSTNLIVAIAKPLVFVILMASSLHILVAYEDARRRGLSAWEGAVHAITTKASGAVLAIIITSIGFASTGTAPVEAMRTFGVIAAVALLFGLTLIVYALPILLGLLGGAARSGLGYFIGPALARIVGWSSRQSFIPLVAALLCVAGSLAILDLRPDPHAIHYLAEEHPLRRDHESLETSGRPLSSIELMISTTSTTLDPETLQTIDRLRRELDALEEVKTVVDPTLLLREGNFRASGLDALPDRMFSDRALRDEAAQFSAFWNPADGRVRISLLIPTLDSPQVHALSSKIERAFEAVRPSPSWTLELTGNHALIVRAQDALLSTLLSSLLLTTLVLQLLLFVALRSLRLGIIALIPNLLPVALNLALMRLLSIPLDVGTSMTAAIALGIALDDTLHFILDYRKTRDLAETARSTGRALVSNTVIIGLGFLVLLPSDFSPTRNFGILCATAMLTALLGNILVLPRLLTRWAPPPSGPAEPGRS